MLGLKEIVKSLLKDLQTREFCNKDINKFILLLKVQSCTLYNKYMIASMQIINIEIFTFTAALVFKLLSRKVLFINRKDNRNC